MKFFDKYGDLIVAVCLVIAVCITFVYSVSEFATLVHLLAIN